MYSGVNMCHISGVSVMNMWHVGRVSVVNMWHIGRVSVMKTCGMLAGSCSEHVQWGEHVAY